MPGPVPKAPNQRRRRNAVSTATMLVPLQRPPAAPKLPPGDWHPYVVAMWKDIWASPMAAEYDPSDIHRVILIADLYQTYWTCPREKRGTPAMLAAEIRLQCQCFGLSPIDRRRLQWTIQKVDEVQDARRRGVARSGRRDDPRLKLGPQAVDA